MPHTDNSPADATTPWQVGDLALCIQPVSKQGLKPGMIGTVRQISVQPFGNTWAEAVERQALTVEGMPDNRGYGPIYPAYKFVKIPPHSIDDEDRETIDLYNNAPVRQKEYSR